MRIIIFGLHLCWHDELFCWSYRCDYTNVSQLAVGRGNKYRNRWCKCIWWHCINILIYFDLFWSILMVFTIIQLITPIDADALQNEVIIYCIIHLFYKLNINSSGNHQNISQAIFKTLDERIHITGSSKSREKINTKRSQITAPYSIVWLKYCSTTIFSYIPIYSSIYYPN